MPTDLPLIVARTPPQDTLADWLALHGAEGALCAALLAAPLPPLPLPAPEPGGRTAAPDLPAPDHFWPQICDHLVRALPAGAELIRRCFVLTQCDFRAGVRASDRALSLLHPEQGVPVVICPWQGRPRDLLCLAHEAGHAVQLLASADRFMPPVLRETCAMLAEYAVLAGLADTDPALGAVFAHRLARDQARRHQLGQGLHRALSQPETPYSYDWNYPLAQHLAGHLWARQTALWPLFEGRQGLRDLWSAPD